MLVPRTVVLQPLQESREHLLRDLAASSLQIGEPRESEVGVQVVGDGVEGPSDRQRLRCPSQLQLCRRRQGVLGYLSWFHVHLHCCRATGLSGEERGASDGRIGAEPARIPAASPTRSKWRLPERPIPASPG